MSLWRERTLTLPNAGDLLARRTRERSTRSATPETAMRNSAVWACIRLRADLISSFPVDVYRRGAKPGAVPEAVQSPPLILAPGGARCRMREWAYSTQVDLDRYGNAFGLVSGRDGQGFPTRIDLVPAGEVTVLTKDGQVSAYRIAGGREYAPDLVWHEKQYTVAGLHVGLSPVAYAAWTLGEYDSIQRFALDWFDNGTRPGATLKNTARTVTPKQSAEIRDVFRAGVEDGGVFVHGSDWDFSMVASEAASSQWLDARAAALVDIARFFGVPADMVDAQTAGQSITYANIAERNLQFLVLHLSPAVARREEAWSFGMLPDGQYVKLNTNSLLRMDLASQSAMLGQQVKDRILTPTEARALYDRAPLTDDDFAEFDRLFGRLPNWQGTYPGAENPVARSAFDATTQSGGSP